MGWLFGHTLCCADLHCPEFYFQFAAGTLRYAKIPIVSGIIAAIVETIRNLPLLLIIFFTFFALPEIGIKLEITAAAITALTILNRPCCQKSSEAVCNPLTKDRLKRRVLQD